MAASLNKLPHRVCIAPMHGYTDRHFRYLMRLMTCHTWLYSEMVVANATQSDQLDRLFQQSGKESPVALQLIGSNVPDLAMGAKIAQDYNYDEVNLNLGCPSPRVCSAGFGIAMMQDLQQVFSAISAMKDSTTLPISLKIRLSDQEKLDYPKLVQFVERIAELGCQTLIVHARTTITKNVSPKKNRKTPLDYESVYRLKSDFPGMEIVINGGITTLSDIKEHLTHLDGAMIGSAALQNPYLFATIDQEIFGDTARKTLSRESIMDQYIEYAKQQESKGTPMRLVMRHLLNLYHGQPNTKKFRQELHQKYLTR